MSLTPLIIKTALGKPDGEQVAANVISVHVVAMYVPSLIVPFFLKVIKHEILTTGGCVLFCGGVAMYWFGYQITALFYVSMALIGIGWNFSFVSSTSLIISAIERPEERFKVQASNDTILFFFGSMVTLLSGVLLESIGIIAILGIVGGWVVIATVLCWIFDMMARKKRPHNFDLKETQALIDNGSGTE